MSISTVESCLYILFQAEILRRLLRLLAFTLPFSSVTASDSVSTEVIVPPSTGATIEIVDFQDPTSELEFSRIYRQDMYRSPAVLGSGWRHNYEIILTGESEKRHIHLYDGRRIEFIASDSSATGMRTYLSKADGTLTEFAHVAVWKSPDGWTRTFKGSYLISIKGSSGQTQTLHYANQLLDTVHLVGGKEIQFVYTDRFLTAVHISDDEKIEFSQNASGQLVQHRNSIGEITHYINRTVPSQTPRIKLECAVQAGKEEAAPASIQDDSLIEPTSAVCDTVEFPPPVDFYNNSTIANSERLDARPASCRSYFVELYGVGRGSAIESGFGLHQRYEGAQATVRSFPVVDFIHNGEALIIKSRDLTSDTYNNGRKDALYNRILQDGKDINRKLLVPISMNGSISVTEKGQTTTLTASDVEKPVLELVIQYGMASPDQIEQIERAALELKTRWNITLRVIEIP